jgi:hypothetical protein
MSRIHKINTFLLTFLFVTTSVYHYSQSADPTPDWRNLLNNEIHPATRETIDAILSSGNPDLMKSLLTDIEQDINRNTIKNSEPSLIYLMDWMSSKIQSEPTLIQPLTSLRLLNIAAKIPGENSSNYISTIINNTKESIIIVHGLDLVTSFNLPSTPELERSILLIIRNQRKQGVHYDYRVINSLSSVIERQFVLTGNLPSREIISEMLMFVSDMPDSRTVKRLQETLQLLLGF